MSALGQGSPPERVPDHTVPVDDEFCRVVGDLTDGALCFPAPFDLPSAMALADNENTGDTAEALFDTTRHQAGRQFRVTVHEITGDPLMEREIVSIVTGAATAAAVLFDVATEMEDLHGG